jgi:DNA repair protein SbcC/Rad50
MEIILKKITLTNFKGIRSFSVVFNQETNIHGNNATGKTTLFDAFLWCIFGKDSTDRKDFEVKTLDENNQPFHKLDHEVEVVLLVDGVKTVLRRLFKEKWTKTRGSETATFAGHTTEFFWNEVPMKDGEYSAKIGEFIKENTFKIITNTTYFNTLKWQDRRAVLLSIAGEIKDSEVLAGLQGVNIKALQQALDENKTVDEFKRQIVAQKKKLKDELDVLPGRISEAERAVPDAIDYTSIENDIEVLQTEIANTDELINNKSAAQKDHHNNISLLLSRKNNLQQANMQIEFDAKNNVNINRANRQANIVAQKNELRLLKEARTTALEEYGKLTKQKEELSSKQISLRAEWAVVNEKELVFDAAEFCCPTCKRDYEQSEVNGKKEELTANFNSNKSTKLAQISSEGKAAGVELADVETKLSNILAEGLERNNTIAKTEERIAALEIEDSRLNNDEAAQIENAIVSNQIHQQNKLEIASLQTQIDTPFNSGNNEALKLVKSSKEKELLELTKLVATKGMRENQLKRVAELKGKEETLNQELAELQGIEYSIEKFTEAKMDTLEQRINGRFKLVKFKMFEEQINGGKTETCITLINGVPYSDANTASKIQAGIDIINTLSEHYDIKAPIWVDNKESVVKLPYTECQLINLIVSAEDSKLRVA